MKNKIAIIAIALVMMTQLAWTKSPTYHGVIIGCCEEYKAGIKGLNAQKDAESFFNKLTDMYYNGNKHQASQNLYLLTEKEVTRNNVQQTLKKVAQKAQPGDVVYFFYSGHGSSLHDKSKLIAPSYKNNELIKVMENSGLIIPYDFNFNQVGKTAIISKRDLRDNHGYGFEYLDNNNVQVIMISDSCYSGNLFRSSSNSTNKFIPTTKLNLDYDAEVAKIKERTHKVKHHQKEYNNLIFFSAGGTDKTVAEDDRLQRGKFSLVVEKCLKNANQNSDNKITKKEFQECLHVEDTAKAFVVYPPNDRLANQTVFKAHHKNITFQQKDKIRVKTSIREIASMSNEVVLDNQNYDIEIVKVGNNYQIFRYTGEEYAKVNSRDLTNYLVALKLFKLKGIGKVDVSVLNGNRKTVGQFCKGERLTAEIKNQSNRDGIVAITLDRKGKVIMLQPNNNKNFSSTLVDMNVQSPFGMDKLKVFTLSNEKQYSQIKKLIVNGGTLEEYGINELYKILKSNQNFKEAELDIETIDQPVSYCTQGD